jgi:hypothetical protein
MAAITYRQALDYIYGFADFERTGTFARDPASALLGCGISIQHAWTHGCGIVIIV